MSHIKYSMLAFILVFFLTGCAPPGTGSRTYTTGQTMSPMTVFSGTILTVNTVILQEQQTGAGAVAGGLAGGAIGSTVGGPRGSVEGTVIGALIGAGVGAMAEMAATTRPGIELEIELDDGRIIVIVQEHDDLYAVGDRVRILQTQDGRMRVRQ
jgi:outer membrane lipoprotein SlyB